MKKKLLIFIITYKASFRLRNVFNEIPFKKLKKYNYKVLICDDASKDDTIIYAKKIKQKNKNIIVIENKKNLGYGGNIKKCLNYSLKNNFNYAVMIHGDGQYSPKYIPELAKVPNKYLFCPWEAPKEILDAAEVKLGETYPEPIVNLKISRERALSAFKSLS